MKKLFVTVLGLFVMLNLSASAALQVDWHAGGGFTLGGGALLGPVSGSLPQSAMAQLIWSPDALQSDATFGNTDYLSGGETLLDSLTVTYDDRASGEYAWWPTAISVYESDAGGALAPPASYETGYIYARIFVDTNPQVNDYYYASNPVAVAPTYHWDGTGTRPLTAAMNMNVGTGTYGDDPIDSGANSFTVQAVPEPGTMALFALGLMSLGISRRRRMQA